MQFSVTIRIAEKSKEDASVAIMFAAAMRSAELPLCSGDLLLRVQWRSGLFLVRTSLQLILDLFAFETTEACQVRCFRCRSFCLRVFEITSTPASLTQKQGTCVN